MNTGVPSLLKREWYNIHMKMLKLFLPIKFYKRQSMGCASHLGPISFISLALVKHRWTRTHNRGLSAAWAHSNERTAVLVLGMGPLLEPKALWLPFLSLSDYWCSSVAKATCTCFIYYRCHCLITEFRSLFFPLCINLTFSLLCWRPM